MSEINRFGSVAGKELVEDAEIKEVIQVVESTTEEISNVVSSELTKAQDVYEKSKMGKLVNES